MRRLWMSLLLVPVDSGRRAHRGIGLPHRRPPTRTAPRRPATVRVLQPGMSSAAVKTLQRRLAALKYYPGAIDGRLAATP